MWVQIILAVLALIFIASGIRIVRPIEVALVETLGKYSKTMKAGFHWVIPIIQSTIYVNLTERMQDVQPQTVITSDKLNAIVDAVVYYQIKDAAKSEYNVDSHRRQLVSLARTTLRAVIGKMSLTEANENRDDINTKVEKILDKETTSYGVEVLRVEIQKIEPPEDVQVAMNEVVKAEQAKIAALDTATALETQADGQRRAKIKVASGEKESIILQAEGKAQGIIRVAEAEAKEIQLVNTSLQKHFKGPAVIHRKLEATENALDENTKFVIDSKSNLVNVMSDAAGVPIVPLKKK